MGWLGGVGWHSRLYSGTAEMAQPSIEWQSRLYGGWHSRLYGGTPSGTAGYMVAHEILVSAQGAFFGFGTKGFGAKGLGPGLDNISHLHIGIANASIASMITISYKGPWWS